TFSPTRPSARSVTNAVSGRSRYCVFSGACNDLNSSAFISYHFERVAAEISKLLLLTPGFSPVQPAQKRNKPFQRFPIGEKPLKRLGCRVAPDTRLKPCVNGMSQPRMTCLPRLTARSDKAML